MLNIPFGQIVASMEAMIKGETIIIDNFANILIKVDLRVL